MAIGKYYIGLDPSMAAFGIAIIDVGKQEIILDQLEADSHHDFVLMSWAISNLWNEFYCKYDKYLESDESYVAQEAPISSGINSGKLNALGYAFYNNIGYNHSFGNIMTYHPMKLKSFHHKKGYTKKDTIAVVESMLDYFKSIGYSIDIRYSRTKKTLNISDGEADAFIYAVKTYIDKRPEAKSTNDLLEMYPRLSVIESIEQTKGYLQN